MNELVFAIDEPFKKTFEITSKLSKIQVNLQCSYSHKCFFSLPFY